MGHALSEEELYYLAIAVCTSAALSLVGSSVIVITFMLFKEVRRELGAQLIFFLNLSDLFMSLSWFPWWQLKGKEDMLCVIQATTLQYFEIASVLWGVCVAITLVLFFNRDDLSPRMTIFHMICWGIPVPVITVCLYMDLFGYAGATWCWISNPQYRLMAYLPCLLFSFINFISFIYLIYKSAGESGIYVSFRRKIYSYLLASFICVLPALANRIQNWIQPHNQIFILFFMQALFQPLQGFVNSLVYGLTDEHYYAQYRKWKLFRKLAPTSALNINTNDDYQPLSLHFDYENGSYQSFPKIINHMNKGGESEIQDLYREREGNLERERERE